MDGKTHDGAQAPPATTFLHDLHFHIPTQVRFIVSWNSNMYAFFYYSVAWETQFKICVHWKAEKIEVVSSVAGPWCNMQRVAFEHKVFWEVGLWTHQNIRVAHMHVMIFSFQAEKLIFYAFAQTSPWDKKISIFTMCCISDMKQWL